jgi:acetyl-CoA C-acetyltransferase
MPGNAPLDSRSAGTPETNTSAPTMPGTRFESDYRYCRLEQHGHLLEVTIDRPEVRNALHPMANEELAAIFDAFVAEPDLWVAILTGTGDDAFCAGNDLKYTAAGGRMWIPDSGFGGLTRRVGRHKPVIAAVNGFAFGGGFEIALACDLIVADGRAQFALPEVRVGLVAGSGGIVRLPRQIPRKLAMELMLTGQSLTAQRALELGLVNEVVAQGAAMTAARELASRIVEVSPTSVRLSMRLLEESGRLASEVEAARLQSTVIDELFASEDMKEGVAAFAQKRAPIWKNR